MTLHPITPQLLSTNKVGELKSEENPQPASSLPQVTTSLSPALQTLRALEQEERFSPLHLYVEVSARAMKNKSPEERLAWIEKEIQSLYTYTMRQRAPRPSTLRTLREMQETILQQNLKRIGSLWPGKNHCFLSADRVRHWLRVEQEVLLTSPDLAYNLVSRCTCLPPELARLLPEDGWRDLSSQNMDLRGSHECFGYALLMQQPEAFIKNWIPKPASIPKQFLQLFLQPEYDPYRINFDALISLYTKEKDLQSSLFLYLERIPIETLSQTQWDSIPKNIFKSNYLCFDLYLRQCPSKQETLHPKWGEWTVKVCKQRSPNPATLLTFCSHLERLSSTELHHAFVALIPLLNENRPLFTLFLNRFSTMPPTFFSQDQWSAIGKILFAKNQDGILGSLAGVLAKILPEALWVEWTLQCAKLAPSPGQVSLMGIFLSKPHLFSLDQIIGLLRQELTRKGPSMERGGILSTLLDYLARQQITFGSSADWEVIGDLLMGALQPKLVPHFTAFLSHTRQVTAPYWGKWLTVLNQLAQQNTSKYTELKNLLLSEMDRYRLKEALPIFQDYLFRTQAPSSSICTSFFKRFVLSHLQEEEQKFFNVCCFLALQKRAISLQEILQALISALSQSSNPALTKEISSDEIKELVYLTRPSINPDICQFSVSSHLPELESRRDFFQNLHKEFFPFFAEDIAIHNAYIAYWEETRKEVGTEERREEPTSSSEPACCCGGG